jgi:Fe2+ or Zn2+ uptake regulation protein
MQTAIEILRAHQLRVTPQRVLLVDVVSKTDGHFTAEEIHRCVQQTYPSVSLVSIYRSLETLRGLGLVTRTELGTHSAQYEWVGTARHHHMICIACGYQLELPDDELEELREHLRARYGFQASIDHHAFFGLCKGCGDRRR